MSENVENPITPTVLIGATAVTPGSDVGTVDPPTVRSLIQVQLGATANAPDATLLARANHTGTQAISSVTGLQTALNGKVDTVYGRGGAVVAATGDYNADQISETASNKVLTAAERTKLAGVATGATANASDALLRDRSTHTGTQAESTVTNLVSDLAAKAPLDSPAFSGTPTAPTPATADNSGRVATTAFTQALLSTVSGGTRYLGNWNAATNTPTLSNGSGVSVPGGFYVVSVAGSTTIDGINSWTVGDWIISDNVGWKKIDQTDAVASVFGRTGSVVASTGDYNADQITETSTNKVLTAAERTKLAGIATGATVNSTDAALRDRTTHTGVQAISTVTGLQASLDSKTTTVFGRTGAVVAVSGDYNADQVTETAAGKILTAAERTKLAGIEVGATADQTNVEIETAYNAQVSVIAQAEAEAGTSTTVRRFTAERIKQAIVALTPANTGASGSNLNSSINLGSPNVVLSTTEAQIGSVTITPSVLGAKILVLSAVYLTKDTGNTTNRIATIRMRRGTSNANPQVGGDLVTRSMAASATLSVDGSIYGGPVTMAYIDTAPSTAAITYTVRGVMSAGGSTANSFHIVAIELTGLSISSLPTITGATDPAADYVVVYDASAGINVKVLLSSLGIGGGALTDGDKGDISVTSGIWSIDPNTVTYAKMQDISATDRILGRQTAGTGDPEEIVCTAAGRALIDDADATAQRTTLGLGTAATQASTAFQATDATLTALAALDATTGLVEETGADTFTKRAMGVGASTSVLTRADGDSRFAPAVHTHSESDVTNLVSDLAAKAPLAGPTFTGVPAAPTAAADTSTTQLATTAYVQGELTDRPQTTRNLVAGVGLSGGGDLSADRTFTVDLQELTTDATGGAVGDFLPFVDVSGGNSSDKVLVSDFITNAALVTTARSVVTGAGLAGGGNLTADRTLVADLNGLTTDATGGASGDFIPFVDISGANSSDKVTVANFITNAGIAPLASPTFTGTPAAPTATTLTNTTQLATTAFVRQELAGSGLDIAGLTLDRLPDALADHVPFRDVSASTNDKAPVGAMGPSKFIDAAARYGVLGDGSTNNATALMAMQADLAGTGKPHFDILMPPGLILYDNSRWLYNIQSADLWGYGTTLRCTKAAGQGLLTPCLYSGEMWTTNTLSYAGANTYTNGYLFNTVAANSQSITMTTSAEANNFAAGDRVLTCGFDQQFTGMPPNHRVFEWLTVASVSAPTVTFTSRLENSYLSTWYDTTNYQGTGIGVGKPRILKLTRTSPDLIYPKYVGFHGIRFANNLNDTVNTGFTVCGENLFYEDCYFEGYVWPSENKNVYFKRCHIERTDFDKLVNNCIVEDCTTGDDGIGAATGINNMEIRRCKIGGYVSVSPRRLTIDDCSLAAPSASGAIVGYPSANPTQVMTINKLRFSYRPGATATEYIAASTPLTFVVDAVNGTDILLDDDSTGKSVIMSIDVGTYLMKSDGSKSGYVTSITWNGTRHVIARTGVAAVAAETWLYDPIQQVVDLGGHTRDNTTVKLYNGSAARWANNKNAMRGGINRLTLTDDCLNWNASQPLFTIPINGFVREVIMDVRKPYTGSDATAKMQWLRTAGFLNILEINVKVQGMRIIRPYATEPVTGSELSGDTVYTSNTQLRTWIGDTQLYLGGAGLTDKNADDLPQMEVSIAWVRGSSG